MPSIFEKLWRLGPSAFVLKAIVAAIVGNVLLLAFILLRRAYRRRYFSRRDARVFELRQQWDALISGQIPYERWRKKAFDRRIVETIALDAFEAAGPEDSARLLKFLRTSGLIENASLKPGNLPAGGGCGRWWPLDVRAHRKAFPRWPKACATPIWKHAWRHYEDWDGRPVRKRRRRFLRGSVRRG